MSPGRATTLGCRLGVRPVSLRAAQAKGEGGPAGGHGPVARPDHGPARQLARRLLPRGPRALRAQRGRPRRVRRGVPVLLQGHRGQVAGAREGAGGLAARSEDAPRPVPRRAGDAPAPGPRGAAQALRGAPARAEGAARRRQPLDRHGRQEPLRQQRAALHRSSRRSQGRRSQRDGGRRRARVPPVPVGPGDRRAADRGRAPQAARLPPRGRRAGARPRRDHRPDGEERRRARESSCDRPASPTCACCCSWTWAARWTRTRTW